IALEEALFVLGEELIAVERIRERSKASARHAGDNVDLVDQAAVLALHDDLRAIQLLEHAVRKRRCARAAAGEREREQRLAILVRSLRGLHRRPITAGRIGLRDRLVDWTAGATG